MCMWPMNFLPRVKTFFFIASLRVGTVIIGVLWLLGSLSLISYSILRLLQLLGVTKSDEYHTYSSDGEKWADVAANAIVAVISIFLFISSMILLLGACAGNMKHLRLWLMINIVLFIIVLLATISRISAEFFMVEADTHKIGHFLKFLFFGTLIVVIYFYCLLVVNSYYQENKK